MFKYSMRCYAYSPAVAIIKPYIQVNFSILISFVSSVRDRNIFQPVKVGIETFGLNTDLEGFFEISDTIFLHGHAQNMDILLVKYL